MVRKAREWLILIVSILLICLHTYYILIGLSFFYILACWHMLLICFVVFFSVPWTGRKGNFTTFDFFSSVILGVASIIAFLYLITKYAETIEAPEVCLTGEIIGLIITLLLLEACRRILGLALSLIALAFLLYNRFGEYFPDFIATQSHDFLTIGADMVFSPSAIFGTPLIVSSTIIFYFILLGSFLSASGALTFFNDFATSLTGRRRGGQAKAAVVGSGLVAMISGSAVANVVMTGTVTIPMMKKAGYRPFYAGAVEAVASSGGQLAPPVMGAAAFIMAMYTGIQYRDICISAALPAFLLYLSIYIAVHIEAIKTNIMPLAASELPKLRDSLMQSYNLISIAVLVYLILAYYPPALCGFVATLVAIVIGFIKKERLNGSKILKAILETAKSIAPVSCACAVAGIVVGVISLTGLGLIISGAIIKVAGGSKIVILVITAFTSIILGMGLPTSACYIILAILVAPAMVKIGIPVIAAHLYVFYYGIISAITPPVALAAYAAAGLAGADPSKTGFTAVKIGIAKYVIPICFVYNPGLVAVGGYFDVLTALAFAIVAIFALQFLVSNYALCKNSVIEEILYLAEVFLLIMPGMLLNFLGLGLFLLSTAFSYFKRRRLQA